MKTLLQLLLIALAGGVSVWAAPGPMTTHTVCASGCDFATIQAALDAVAPDDTIMVLDAVHTEAGILVGTSVKIAGLGIEQSIIQAAALPDEATHAIFYVGPGINLMVHDLTLRHGHDSYGFGGAIYNQGRLTVEHVALRDNSAQYGGGIYNLGVLTMTASSLIGNEAMGEFSYGGGLANYGTVTLSQSTIAGNHTGVSGAGIYNGETGSVTVTTSSFENNVTDTGSGAGILSEGALSVETSLFRNNIAAYGGAGIWALNATLRSSTFSNNTGLTYGGALITGNVIMEGCTLENNTAVTGGGVYNLGNLIVYNSTFVRNGGPGVQSIANAGNLTLVNTTTYNDAPTDSPELGGLPWVTGVINAQNSIIANPNNSAVCADAILTDGAPNLATDNSCGFTLVANAVGLGPLQSNGGPTWTMALLPHSPALDAGHDATCRPTDQRGFARPAGAACDLGAVEMWKNTFLPLILRAVAPQNSVH